MKKKATSKAAVTAPKGWMVKSPSGSVLEIVEISVTNQWVPEWKSHADHIAGKPADSHFKAGSHTTITVMKKGKCCQIAIPDNEELVIKKHTQEVVWRLRETKV